ncbi:hypothetical protein D3C85_1098180 [compost metagenome]
MTKKITKEAIWTELKVLQAKLDLLIELNQHTVITSDLQIDYDWREPLNSEDPEE